MPIVKRSEDYVDFIYEAIKYKYDIVISKTRIRKILTTFEKGICEEIVNGNVIMFGNKAKEANFVYLSQRKHPRLCKGKVFMTQKHWRKHKDPVGLIKRELYNNNKK